MDGTVSILVGCLGSLSRRDLKYIDLPSLTDIDVVNISKGGTTSVSQPTAISLANCHLPGQLPTYLTQLPPLFYNPPNPHTYDRHCYLTAASSKPRLLNRPPAAFQFFQLPTVTSTPNFTFPPNYHNPTRFPFSSRHPFSLMVLLPLSLGRAAMSHTFNGFPTVIYFLTFRHSHGKYQNIY